MSNEPNKTTPSFTALSEARRGMFVRLNYGFLRDVTDAMRADGTVNGKRQPYSRSTVTRTWYGEFLDPNPAIVAALDTAYRRIVDRDKQRRSRLLKRRDRAA